MTTRSENYIGGLNGLRGLACLAVFAVHFQQKTGVAGRWGPFDLERLLANGHVAVALFLILSGFLLSLPYWSGRVVVSGRWLGWYVARRVGRLLPAYFAWLVVLIVWQRHVAGPKEWMDCVLHFVLLHNYADFAYYGVSEPFWYVAIQGQMYVLFALLLVVLSRADPRGRGAWVTVAVVGAGMYLLHWGLCAWAGRVEVWGFSQMWVARDGPVVTRSVLAHGPLFLLGVLAGRLWVAMDVTAGSDVGRSGRGWNDFVFWLGGAVVVVVLATPLEERIGLPYGRYVFPWVPVVLTGMVLCGPRGRLSRGFLEWGPMRGLGVVSYGVYLGHNSCMNLVVKGLRVVGMSAEENWAVFGVASLVLTVVVAGAMYVVIERPILRWVRGRGVIELNNLQ